MLKILNNKNIFDYRLNIAVNTVNCKGVMGKGIALEFKNKYPDMFKIYKQICINKELFPGDIFVYKNKNIWIINVATKNHWKYPSKYKYVFDGINNIKKYIKILKIKYL